MISAGGTGHQLLAAWRSPEARARRRWRRSGCRPAPGRSPRRRSRSASPRARRGRAWPPCARPARGAAGPRGWCAGGRGPPRAPSPRPRRAMPTRCWREVNMSLASPSGTDAASATAPTMAVCLGVERAAATSGPAASSSTSTACVLSESIQHRDHGNHQQCGHEGAPRVQRRPPRKERVQPAPSLLRRQWRGGGLGKGARRGGQGACGQSVPAHPRRDQHLRGRPLGGGSGPGRSGASGRDPGGRRRGRGRGAHARSRRPLRVRGFVRRPGPHARGGGGGGPLPALATPGHSADSVCLLMGRVCFTGDTVLGTGSVFISPGRGVAGAPT